jgi:hypothetical protein
MNNAEDKTRTQTKEDIPYTNTISNQHRYMIKEEIRAQLLEQVRKDVGTILDNIEVVENEERKKITRQQQKISRI